MTVSKKKERGKKTPAATMNSSAVRDDHDPYGGPSPLVSGPNFILSLFPLWDGREEKRRIFALLPLQSILGVGYFDNFFKG